MRAKPHPAVLAWMAARSRAALVLLCGIAMLSEGPSARSFTVGVEAIFPWIWSVETPMVIPDGRLHLLARVPRRRPHGLCRGRHHAQGRRPSDDLPRLRTPADLRPRGSRLCA